MSDMASSQ